MTKKRSTKLFEALKKFGNIEKYKPILDSLSTAYLEEDNKVFDKTYKKLPTQKELLEKLLKKLKKKSTYTGLKKVLEGKDTSIEQAKIALSSLYTHIVIEEKKNPEYKMLEKEILKKLVNLNKISK